MAEAVFAHTVKQHDLEGKISKIDSAGTASYHVKKEARLFVFTAKTDMYCVLLRLEVCQTAVVPAHVRLMVSQSNIKPER
jgi:hypothetical protein